MEDEAAHVFAIGPFCDSVKDRLQFSESSYRGTRTGSVVATKLFRCKNMNEAEFVASLLGCSLFNFNNHYIKSFKAKGMIEGIEARAELLDDFYAKKFREDIRDFKWLARFNFDFMFFANR